MIGFNAGDRQRFEMIPRNDSFTLGIEETSNIGIAGTYSYRVDLDLIIEPTGTILNIQLMLTHS